MNIETKVIEPTKSEPKSNFPLLAKWTKDDCFKGEIALFLDTSTGMIISTSAGVVIGTYSIHLIPITNSGWELFPPGTQIVLTVKE